MINLEEHALALEASPDYRVLRRLTTIPVATTDATVTFGGMYVDCESTGLDTKLDDIIEFGAIPFTFTSDGFITSVSTPIHSYNQPSKKISPEITKLTGIDHAMVMGKHLPKEVIAEAVGSCKLIIAHNAAFDRPMCERAVPAFKDVCWGCSMSQVPWGTAGRRLEYLLASLGRFYDAHNAVSDCEAGVFALGATVQRKETIPMGVEDKEPNVGRTALSYVLDASRKTTWHVWAIDAPFAGKDVLKGKGYSWNGGEDGRPKSWHREVDNREDEEAWLRDNVYGRALVTRARFDKVTAFERFSKRG